MTDDNTPVSGMTAREIEFYGLGYQHGVAAMLDAEDARWWAVRAEGGRIARVIAQRPSYADLCEHRGEHAAAEAQRATMVRNGLVAA